MKDNHNNCSAQWYKICVNIESVNGLLPGDTKLIHVQML